MESIRIEINGQEIEARPGQTILEVVHEQDLDRIPTLCHSPELEPYGSCFVCVVELEGRPNLVPSCATRVTPGMKVRTRNERVVAARRTALELLLSNHYADCVSPCLEACPAHVDVQGYLALSAMGLEREAVDRIRETNPLPAICGRVCVRKCEVACRRQDVDESVAINNVKRYLTDVPGVYDHAPQVADSTGRTVGIVGAGPAGLTAAWFLARKGHKPVLYEAMEQGGGMLRYGIPAYRLPDAVIDREIAYIERAGAEIRYGVRVGDDLSLDELRRRHDAVFVSNGAWTGKSMRVEGEWDTEGVVTGVDFLCEKAEDPQPLQGTVAVVGGGNTAMDVSRTAWRLGAEKVLLLYRRTKAEMPADEEEIRDCIDEGIEIMELVAPIGIVRDGNRLRALRCIRMKLGEPDASGRRRPLPLEGSEFEVPCALAVSAIGQNPVMDGLTHVQGEEISLTRWGTFKLDTTTMATNVEGVFAGGDAAEDGPTVVIDAIGDGRRAATAIHAWIQGEAPPAEPFVVRKEHWSKPGKAELGDVSESPRHHLQHLDVADRAGNFREVATGFDPEDMHHECERCLSCGCVEYDTCDLRLQAEEYGADLDRFKGYVRKHKVDDRHPYLIYDPNKCVLCSRCIRTCARVLPIAALGLVGRGFRTEMRPAMNDPLVRTNCIACGNCVEACPTGALQVKHPFPGRAALPVKKDTTHCGFCSIACPTTVNHFGPNRYYVSSSGEPGDYLCRYGRFGTELFIKERRVTHPHVREGVEHLTVELPDAINRAVRGLKAVAEDHGPESVAVFVSPELSNEELYVAGRIAREGLGTRNVASLSMLSTGWESGRTDALIGFTGSTADRSALHDADLIVCNNTSTEADHLVLAVDIMDTVRKRGADLLVCNSTLDTADRALASVALDPMRGRASWLWVGVVRVLLEQGYLSRRAISSVPGGSQLLSSFDLSLQQIVDRTGVELEKILRAAEHVKKARRVVFVHSPDRGQDASPGDLEVLATLAVLLRAAGVRADLLLAWMNANAAALDVVGASPAFRAGRQPVTGVAGARSWADLRASLEAGRIRGALVVGEDPMRHNRTAAWLQNIEFMVAMDWSRTETVQFADVALPGSTFLESPGTRCNFEGRRVIYNGVVQSPAGISGWRVLTGLCGAFGVRVPAGSAPELVVHLDGVVRKGLGRLTAHLWNTGEPRTWTARAELGALPLDARGGRVAPPLTHSDRYKHELREVGAERFRVHPW